MSIPRKSLSTYMLSTFVLLVFFVAPIYGLEPSRKLDETGVPGSSDPSIKCGGCSPCGHPSCYQSPPPPPPPSPPPPPKKPPSTAYCPPPPAGGIIYFSGPPTTGSLYPVDPSYNSGPGRNLATAVKILLGYSLLELFMLWT